MARTQAKNDDFLGLMALGLGITSLVQTAGKNKLQVMYDQVVQRYRMLHGEYMAYRGLNTQLQSQVDELRMENNRLLKELAKRPEPVKT